MIATEEQQLIRDTARAFAREKLAPLSLEFLSKIEMNDFRVNNDDQLLVPIP